ncbi:EbsA family protein [Dellaglioa algida]|uniref:Pore-forming protein n=1 Tax=Dellaglioa algida TaxID=105612 RepID=A0A2C8ELL7_9LACO|nr:EbsA family protein [Dellaglioa algida]MDK1716574.1 EbsA family protein [Dellaglioa algida]MDK1718003.1 EbsA family protein [Dellaglioa algida]MDK1719933.1 EbsA family protein [Dellaglioa algida]MDK1721516.1 EbsA family protein [Dellaglioa algida]MDK1724187.1 EbsA family protein [Dellaglioa algida]
MQRHQKTYFYQPELAKTVILWSWTFCLLLSSLLLWLEITTLQIWTIILFVIFLIVSVIQIFSRKLIIDDKHIKLTKVIRKYNETIEISEIKKVKLRRFGLSFYFSDGKKTIVLNSRSKLQLYTDLQKDK